MTYTNGYGQNKRKHTPIKWLAYSIWHFTRPKPKLKLKYKR